MKTVPKTSNSFNTSRERPPVGVDHEEANTASSFHQGSQRTGTEQPAQLLDTTQLLYIRFRGVGMMRDRKRNKS